MSSKRKQRGIKSEINKKKGEERATRKNQDCYVTFKPEHVTSTQSKDGGGGYGRVKLPPPYSVPLPSVRDPTSVTRDNFVSDHK